MRAIILIFILAFTLISCNEKIKNSEENVVNFGLVELNNGDLWMANSETTLGINKMISRMSYFSENENALAYQNLKDSLESDFTEIFQKCSMKGEAHNQLHNYLKPMIELFDGLSSQEMETRINSFNDLDKHLNSYRNFFE